MDKQYYQSILLAHYKAPIGLGEITEEFIIGTGTNPLCGDEICVGVKVDKELITDIRFKARACSICIASSSIMVQLLLNQNISQATQLHAQVLALLHNKVATQDVVTQLQPLSSIVSMPSRHKCSLLSWEALLYALKY